MTGESFEIVDSIQTVASRDQVMALLLDPGSWSLWQSEIISAEGASPLSEGDVVQGRARMMGFDVNGQSVALEVTEDSYEQNAVVGVGMHITYSVERTPHGTIVTHRLSSRLPTGSLGRVLSFFLKRRLRKMQKELLKALKDQAEDPSI